MENMIRKKKVVGAAKIGPNYAFHLMAAARIGFDSSYADRYASSIVPDDMAFLDRHRDLLTFGGGSTSELVAPIIAWPAYFNLDSQQALQEQFDLLEHGWSSGDYNPFLKKYDAHISKMAKWWYTISEDLLKMLAPHRELIISLGQIMVRNFEAYHKGVWPKELPRLNAVARDIDEYFETTDAIGDWEKLTNLTFHFDTYEIVLCSAIENGPNANSLGYDQVVFFPETPLKTMMEFISHEIGTHILMDVLKSVHASGRFDFPALYEGYELLARYYNTIILGESPLSYPMSTFHVDEYLEVFDRLYKSQPDVSPHDLLVRGITAFPESETTP